MKKKKPSLTTTVLLTILKTPYYLGKGLYAFTKRIKKESKDLQVQKRREKLAAKYNEFNIIKQMHGNYEKWESNLLKAESKIGIILGARGTGKTAIGIKFLENLYAKTKAKCYALGFKKETMPSWIETIHSLDEIKNNSTVLIDEGGVLFSSRKAMTKPNKLLSDLILISRHKNLNILFISQNSSNLDVNIIRQADFLILKPTSLLQKDFERKKIRDIYTEVEKHFNKYKTHQGLTYIYSNDFQGFVTNPLPSFWNVNISKSFR